MLLLLCKRCGSWIRTVSRTSVIGGRASHHEPLYVVVPDCPRRCPFVRSGSQFYRKTTSLAVGSPREIALPRLPQIRACTISAPGSSTYGFAA